ncbi:uncharacterized protein LOC128209642 [Mya arenaria]|uniref:uncharacterized protein LOC128209642 n=1 Tax=Mya arenaria TaxID=6604 RepID=UPI0022DF65F9|nr:uncharacterized protein LOC128209642 [Mya arenaria]
MDVETDENLRFIKLVDGLISVSYLMFKLMLKRCVLISKPAETESTESWTLDDLLFEKKSKILSRETGKAKEKVFFPGRKKDTNVENWDLNMFCFILSEICDIPDETNVKQAVESLKSLKDILFQNARAKLSENEYAKYSRLLENATDTCIRFIEDDSDREEMKTKIKKLYDKGIEEVTPPNDQLIHVLQNWHMNEKYNKEILQELPRDAVDKLERAARIVSLRDERDKRRQKGSTEVLPPRADITPEIKTTLLFKPEDHNTTHVVCKMFREETAPKVACPPWPPEHQVLKRAVGEVCQKLTKMKIKPKAIRNACVEITMQSESITAMITFLNMYESRELDTVFRPVIDAIQELPGHESYSQEIVIYKEDFDQCVTDIANHLDEIVEEFGDDLESLTLGPINETKEGAVEVVLTNTFGEMDVKYNEEIHDIFAKLHEAARTTFPDQELIVEIRLADLLHEKSKSGFKPVDERDNSIQERSMTDVTIRKKMLKHAQSSGEIDSGSTIIPPAKRSQSELSPSSRIPEKDVQTKLADTINMKMEGDVEPAITGLCQLCQETIIACDLKNNSVKLVDLNAAKCVAVLRISQRKCYPWNACAVNDHSAAITVPEAGKVALFVVEEDGLREEKSFFVGKGCRGIDFKSGTFYISFESPRARIEFGDDLGNLKYVTEKNEKIFQNPWCLKLGDGGKRLYVSESMNPRLIVLEIEEGEITKVQALPTEKHIKTHRGLAIGPNGNVFMCGYLNNVVCMIHTETRQTKVVLNSDDISPPDSVLYLSDTEDQLPNRKGQLVVGMYNCSDLKIFDMHM